MLEKVDKIFKELGDNRGGASGKAGPGGAAGQGGGPNGPTEKEGGDKSQKKGPVPPEGPDNRRLYALAAGLLVVGYVVSEMLALPNTKEISWQEFEADLLAKGKVKKIRVETAEERALVFREGSVSPSFHIELGPDFGAFERRLENAELDHNCDETPLEFHESAITRCASPRPPALFPPHTASQALPLSPFSLPPSSPHRVLWAL